MQQYWGRILALLGLLLFFIPGTRRRLFNWAIRNNTLRNIGIQTVLATPVLRERMLNKILPNRQPF